ncbi:MAG TPA: hypothetical protein VFE33_19055 [Thermoanaerobaculia bacterium]|nr:hypothetical protein [Thermoanaerobaculia bacterium]
MAKADLHVHSKHSNRPTEWILRQAQAPESFTEPKEIYRLCRERGMDFVTVSDHDSVAGALEIAHLPGVFLSSEVTVAFPEDGTHVHCLVSGVTEAQHREIQRLSGNVYELRDYLVAEAIVHSVAHPLVRVNGRLSLAQFEKLLVLFNRFEGLNGIHDRRANELLRRIVDRLDRGVIEDLAARHRLRPHGPRPWVKSLTGGSDDHGGFYIATTWTETPPAATVEAYLAHLKADAHVPGGATGSTLRLTQSLYGIAYEFYRRRFLPLLSDRSDPFARLLQLLATPPTVTAEPPARRRLFFLSAPGRRRKRPAAPAAGAGTTPDQETFGFASQASRRALQGLLEDFAREIRRGRLSRCLGAAANLAPFALTLSPFLVALHAQHRDRDLVDGAAERFLGFRGAGGVADRAAWFTDDPAADLPWAETALAASGLAEMAALTCGEGQPPGIPVRRFAPLAELPLPVRARLSFAVPPVLEVLEHCERERYAQIFVSTPGPMGLLAVAAGKILGLKITSLLPADLPARVLRETGSEALADGCREYLRWLSGQMDEVGAVEMPLESVA